MTLLRSRSFGILFAILLVFTLFSFAADLDASADICPDCEDINEYLPSGMIPIVDYVDRSISLSMYFENLTNPEAPRGAVKNAPVFYTVTYDTVNGIETKGPYLAFTDSNGEFNLDMKSYAPPGDTACKKVKYVYCPYLCTSDCTKCLTSFKLEPVDAISSTDLADAKEKWSKFQDPRKVLPVADSIEYCQPFDKFIAPPFCLPFLLIFAFMAGAMYLAGKNPLAAFDMSSPRLGRHIKYVARGRGVSIDVGQIAMAAYSAVKAGQKDMKDIKAEGGGAKGWAKASGNRLTAPFTKGESKKDEKGNITGEKRVATVGSVLLGIIGLGGLQDMIRDTKNRKKDTSQTAGGSSASTRDKPLGSGEVKGGEGGIYRSGAGWMPFSSAIMGLARGITNASNNWSAIVNDALVETKARGGWGLGSLRLFADALFIDLFKTSVIGWAISDTASFGGYADARSLTNERNELLNKKEGVMVEIGELEGRISAKQKEFDDLDKKAPNYEVRSKSLTAEIASLKDKLSDANDRLVSVRRDLGITSAAESFVLRYGLNAVASANFVDARMVLEKRKEELERSGDKEKLKAINEEIDRYKEAERIASDGSGVVAATLASQAMTSTPGATNNALAEEYQRGGFLAGASYVLTLMSAGLDVSGGTLQPTEGGLGDIQRQIDALKKVPQTEATQRELTYLETKKELYGAQIASFYCSLGPDGRSASTANVLRELGLDQLMVVVNSDSTMKRFAELGTAVAMADHAVAQVSLWRASGGEDAWKSAQTELNDVNKKLSDTTLSADDRASLEKRKGELEALYAPVQKPITDLDTRIATLRQGGIILDEAAEYSILLNARVACFANNEARAGYLTGRLDEVIGAKGANIQGEVAVGQNIELQMLAQRLDFARGSDETSRVLAYVGQKQKELLADGFTAGEAQVISALVYNAKITGADVEQYKKENNITGPVSQTDIRANAFENVLKGVTSDKVVSNNEEAGYAVIMHTLARTDHNMFERYATDRLGELVGTDHSNFHELDKDKMREYGILFQALGEYSPDKLREVVDQRFSVILGQGQGDTIDRSEAREAAVLKSVSDFMLVKGQEFIGPPTEAQLAQLDHFESISTKLEKPLGTFIQQEGALAQKASQDLANEINTFLNTTHSAQNREASDTLAAGLGVSSQAFLDHLSGTHTAVTLSENHTFIDENAVKQNMLMFAALAMDKNVILQEGVLAAGTETNFSGNYERVSDVSNAALDTAVLYSGVVATKKDEAAGRDPHGAVQTAVEAKAIASLDVEVSAGALLLQLYKMDPNANITLNRDLESYMRYQQLQRELASLGQERINIENELRDVNAKLESMKATSNFDTGMGSTSGDYRTVVGDAEDYRVLMARKQELEVLLPAIDAKTGALTNERTVLEPTVRSLQPTLGEHMEELGLLYAAKTEHLRSVGDVMGNLRYLEEERQLSNGSALAKSLLESEVAATNKWFADVSTTAASKATVAERDSYYADAIGVVQVQRDTIEVYGRFINKDFDPSRSDGAIAQQLTSLVNEEASKFAKGETSAKEFGSTTGVAVAIIKQDHLPSENNVQRREAMQVLFTLFGAEKDDYGSIKTSLDSIDQAYTAVRYSGNETLVDAAIQRSQELAIAVKSGADIFDRSNKREQDELQVGVMQQIYTTQESFGTLLRDLKHDQPELFAAGGKLYKANEGYEKAAATGGADEETARKAFFSSIARETSDETLNQHLYEGYRGALSGNLAEVGKQKAEIDNSQVALMQQVYPIQENFERFVGRLEDRHEALFEEGGALYGVKKQYEDARDSGDAKKENEARQRFMDAIATYVPDQTVNQFLEHDAIVIRSADFEPLLKAGRDYTHALKAYENGEISPQEFYAARQTFVDEHQRQLLTGLGNPLALVEHNPALQANPEVMAQYEEFKKEDSPLAQAKVMIDMVDRDPRLAQMFPPEELDKARHLVDDANRQLSDLLVKSVPDAVLDQAIVDHQQRIRITQFTPTDVIVHSPTVQGSLTPEARTLYDTVTTQQTELITLNQQLLTAPDAQQADLKAKRDELQGKITEGNTQLADFLARNVPDAVIDQAIIQQTASSWVEEHSKKPDYKKAIDAYNQWEKGGYKDDTTLDRFIEESGRLDQAFGKQLDSLVSYDNSRITRTDTDSQRAIEKHNVQQAENLDSIQNLDDFVRGHQEWSGNPKIVDALNAYGTAKDEAARDAAERRLRETLSQQVPDLQLDQAIIEHNAKQWEKDHKVEAATNPKVEKAYEAYQEWRDSGYNTRDESFTEFLAATRKTGEKDDRDFAVNMGQLGRQQGDYVTMVSGDDSVLAAAARADKARGVVDEDDYEGKKARSTAARGVLTDFMADYGQGSVAFTETVARARLGMEEALKPINIPPKKEEPEEPIRPPKRGSGPHPKPM